MAAIYEADIHGVRSFFCLVVIPYVDYVTQVRLVVPAVREDDLMMG